MTQAITPQAPEAPALGGVGPALPVTALPVTTKVEGRTWSPITAVKTMAHKLSHPSAKQEMVVGGLAALAGVAMVVALVALHILTAGGIVGIAIGAALAIGGTSILAHGKRRYDVFAAREEKLFKYVEKQHKNQIVAELRDLRQRAQMKRDFKAERVEQAQAQQVRRRNVAVGAGVGVVGAGAVAYAALSAAPVMVAPVAAPVVAAGMGAMALAAAPWVGGALVAGLVGRAIYQRATAAPQQPAASAPVVVMPQPSAPGNPFEKVAN